MITTTTPESIYCQYPGQTEPQPCCLYVDLDDETIRCAYNPEIGGAVTAAQWHGHMRAYRIPTGYTVESQAWLMDRVRPLVERMVAGYESRWDGSNHVARLDADAEAAEREIESICEREYEYADESSCESHWDAADWYVDGWRATLRDLGITAATTDDQIEEIAEREEEAALADGHHIHGIVEYLIRARNAMERE